MAKISQKAVFTTLAYASVAVGGFLLGYYSRPEKVCEELTPSEREVKTYFEGYTDGTRGENPKDGLDRNGLRITREQETPQTLEKEQPTKEEERTATAVPVQEKPETVEEVKLTSQVPEQPGKLVTGYRGIKENLGSLFSEETTSKEDLQGFDTEEEGYSLEYAMGLEDGRKETHPEVLNQEPVRVEADKDIEVVPVLYPAQPSQADGFALPGTNPEVHKDRRRWDAVRQGIEIGRKMAEALTQQEVQEHEDRGIIIGYEMGYEQGGEEAYEMGHADGFAKGHAAGSKLERSRSQDFNYRGFVAGYNAGVGNRGT